jgi:hypothetical protein
MAYIGAEPIVSATRTVTEVTATAGQTVFTANGGYTVGYLDVFLNGVQLQTVDFTATNGSTVTLGSAASSGDEVRLVAWGTFNTNSIQGNLALTGTAARITGDFSNSTAANRVFFQTSTTNGNANIGVLPNGTGNTTNFIAYNTTDPANSSRIRMGVNATESFIFSDITGTGTYTPMLFATGGSEKMRIDTSGNVGIGISYPGTKLQVVNTGSTDTRISVGNTNAGFQMGVEASGPCLLANFVAQPIYFATNGTEQMRLTSAGLLQFNSGYGSVATAYGCRAWVNFNGTGTVAIRASGNVSSITDNGTGNYNVNFTTAMTDANYCTNVTAQNTVSSDYGSVNSSGVATSFARVDTFRRDTGVPADCAGVFVSVFR